MVYVRAAAGGALASRAEHAVEVPWVLLPDDVPTFEAYYDSTTLWPAESLARLRAALPRRR